MAEKITVIVVLIIFAIGMLFYDLSNTRLHRAPIIGERTRP